MVQNFNNEIERLRQNFFNGIVSIIYQIHLDEKKRKKDAVLKEKERIAELLTKAGKNKISILNTKNATKEEINSQTYWISLKDAYQVITGRELNKDIKNGFIKNKLLY